MKKDDLKSQMLKFIGEKYPNVQEIVSVVTQDWDDDDGVIGENYIVECFVYGTLKQKTCKVNRAEFDRYYKKENAIKWIN